MIRKSAIPFKQQTVSRALSGAKNAGLSPTSITISKSGEITLHFDRIEKLDKHDYYDQWAMKRGKIAA